MTVVAGQLTTGPNTVVNGVLSVCPGDEISITCNHSNVAGGFSRWEIDVPLFSIRNCVRRVDHNSPNGPTPCGPVTFTNSSITSGPLMSTATVTVTKELNGAVLKCLAGAPSSSPQVGNVTINVFGEALLFDHT